MSLGTRLEEKLQTSCRFWQPSGPGIATLGVLAEGLLQGRGTPGFPSWRAVWPDCGSKFRLPNVGLPFLLPPAQSGPCTLVSRHSGGQHLPSQGPRVSGENRSLEEQCSEPAQALNIISSSLNRIGTGAKESVGPPSRSQLSRPGAYLDGSLALQAASLFLLVKAAGLRQVGSPCKSLISSPWETSQVKRTVC